jgi:hypothetical protein
MSLHIDVSVPAAAPPWRIRGPSSKVQKFSKVRAQARFVGRARSLGFAYAAEPFVVARTDQPFYHAAAGFAVLRFFGYDVEASCCVCCYCNKLLLFLVCSAFSACSVCGSEREFPPSRAPSPFRFCHGCCSIVDRCVIL